MEFAKAIALGGKIIHANECHYSSYIELGLRCPVCGEPVHLRNGDYKRAYFAHFPSVDTKQVEECELRMAGCGNSTQTVRSNFTSDKEQRLKVFQNFFLDIITSNVYDFYNVVQFVKFAATYNKLKFVVKRCNLWFREHENYIRNNYCTSIKNNVNGAGMLEKQIACEAIDYFCAASSISLLEKLICYSIYNCYKATTLDWESWTSESKYFDICKSLLETIINIPWLVQLRKNSCSVRSMVQQGVETETTD